MPFKLYILGGICHVLWPNSCLELFYKMHHYQNIFNVKVHLLNFINRYSFMQLVPCIYIKWHHYLEAIPDARVWHLGLLGLLYKARHERRVCPVHPLYIVLHLIQYCSFHIRLLKAFCRKRVYFMFSVEPKLTWYASMVFYVIRNDILAGSDKRHRLSP